MKQPRGGEGDMVADPLPHTSDHSHPFVVEEEDDDDVQQQHQEEEAVVGQKESKTVGKTRCLVFGVMLVAMIAVALAVYFLTRRNETTKFENQFAEDAHKVFQSIGTTLDFTLGGIDEPLPREQKAVSASEGGCPVYLLERAGGFSHDHLAVRCSALAVSVVSHARATNQTWPFVTIPDWGVRAEKTRSLTNAVFLNLFANLQNQSQRDVWEQEYSPVHGPEWVTDVMELQEREDIYQEMLYYLNSTLPQTLNRTLNHVHNFTGGYVQGDGPFLPQWQTFPLVPPAIPPYNWDLYSSYDKRSMNAVLETHKVTVTEAYLIAYPNQTQLIAENQVYADYMGAFLTTGEDPMEPASDIFYPVLKDAADYIHVPASSDDGNKEPNQDNLGAIISISFYWRDFLKGILPGSSRGILAVFESGCNPTFTYQINGPQVEFLGAGDHHEARFAELGQSGFLVDLSREFSLLQSVSYSGLPVNEEVCPFEIRLYPSSTMEQMYLTSWPLVFALTAVLVFVVTSAAFIIHDIVVERRNRVVTKTAVQSDRIVSSLFPAAVKERLYQENSSAGPDAELDSSRRQFLEDGASQKTGFKSQNFLSSSFGLSSHVASNELNSSARGSSDIPNGLPIADVYKETTVLFADLAGFTAWSSTREPQQVFILLETLYASFDKSAKKLNVFKVETIGDCYVAVTGLPQPRKNHAVIMARFAAVIRDSMNQLTHQLEATLSGANKLRLRTGIHSGQVTAGVLRGAKSRFQLFGDTVNTSARMESNGMPNKIHASEATAERLIQAGKETWLTKRPDLVEAKGKGKMQTYWVEPPHSAASTAASSDYESIFSFAQASNDTDGVQRWPQHTGISSAADEAVLQRRKAFEQRERLVERVCAMLEDQLMILGAKRHSSRVSSLEVTERVDYLRGRADDRSSDIRAEVVHAIAFPPFTNHVGSGCDSGTSPVLPTVVSSELRSCVSAIAHTHRDTNAFHNFEQSCRAAFAMNDMLKEVAQHNSAIASTDAAVTQVQDLQLYTGRTIASEPTIQLALLFAALGSSVDHPGVPNQLLVGSPLAACYNNKSIAEQNAFEVTWTTFMDPGYRNLHSFMFGGGPDSGLNLFRQLMVNSFIAMDIADPDLESMRQERWKRAFAEKGSANSKNEERMTVLLEYLVQGATCGYYGMTDWVIYQESNAQLYREAAAAHAAGRGEDPSEYWFEQELSKFDELLIPLADRLSNALFSSPAAGADDRLVRVKDNRREWNSSGRAIVQGLAAAAAAEQSHGTFGRANDDSHCIQHVTA